MTYDRSERIRRAAILVASLDEALAEQVLAELPPVERARVLDEAERLEEIDADERQDVLAEFRRLARSRRGGGVAIEFAASGSEEASSGERGAKGPSASRVAAAGATLSDSDAAAMAELLSHEHPQIVAAALSRLGDDPCAAVFAALPPSLQAEALARLASLAPADEEAVLEVESQLQHRMQQRRDLAARSAAGAALVEKILARTPSAQRMYLLERLSSKNGTARPATPSVQNAPEANSTLTFAAAPTAVTVDPLAQQARNLARAVRRAREAGAYDAYDGSAHGSPIAPATGDCMEELDLLNDEALVAALRLAGERTVLRALAASGEAFLNRVAGMLPRRQARKLRRMLRGLGPTRLADLHAAQHELLRLAHDCTAAGARREARSSQAA